MPRTRRPWSELRDDIRRLLNDESTAPHWSDADLLALFNECRDYRELELYDQHEGFGVEIFSASIVAGQREYELPEQCARIKRVFIVDSGGGLKRVAHQDRQYTGTYLGDDVQGGSNLFSYDLKDNHIFLYPTPSSAVVNGLQVEAEVATDRIDNDADKLPDSWPPYAETLLVLDTAIAALEMQATAEGDLGQSQITWLERRRSKLEDRWFEYTANRATSFVFSPRFDQGA